MPTKTVNQTLETSMSAYSEKNSFMSNGTRITFVLQQNSFSAE